MAMLDEKISKTRRVRYIDTNLVNRAFDLNHIPKNTELPFAGYTKDCGTIPVKLWDAGAKIDNNDIKKIKDKGINEVFVKEEEYDKAKEIIQENIEQVKELDKELEKNINERNFIEGMKNYFCIDKNIIQLAKEINFSIYVLNNTGIEKIFDHKDKNDLITEKHNIIHATKNGDICISLEDMGNYIGLINRLNSELSNTPNATFLQKALTRETTRVLLKQYYESKGSYKHFRALQNIVSSLISVYTNNKFANIAFLGHHYRHIDIHAYNTAIISLLLGSEVLNSDLLYDLTFTALVHDIGKMEITYNILIKCGSKMSDVEYGILRNHVERGPQMVKQYFSPTMLNVIRKHHIKADGRGYPDPYKEKLVNMPEKILSIANSFDNLITPNKYCLKAALKPHEAISKLQQEILEKKDRDLIYIYKKLINILK